MKIVDFHTHLFSSAFFETLAAQSPIPGDVHKKLADASRKAGFQLPVRDVAEHTARWLAELEKHDVEHMAAFASVPEEIPAVCEAAAISKGRISAFALVNPRVEGAAARVRALLHERKIRGVLLFPAMHHYHVGGIEAKTLFDALSEHDAIVYVHCGLLIVKLRDLLQLPRPQDLTYANPLGVIPAANAHPRVRFVIPHFGAGFFRETLMAGASASNVFVDTSSSNSWMATQSPKPTLTEVFSRALEAFGHERILFGTDSNTFPAGWRKDRFEQQHAALSSLSLGAAQEEAIFAGNARRLLGLT
jgi:predicted TIM-barrel fold metal-dependent hydrolase